jgi:hypothetical protein
MKVNNITIDKLFQCFPNSFINGHEEFVAYPKTNLYFIIGNCESSLDVKCKVLEWFSRDASKATPYRSREKNKRYNEMIRERVNAFLGTNFTTEEMLQIYTKLGNAVNRELTVKFIINNYHMSILED